MRTATFDAAFLITVLGEIPDQEEALEELARVLKPGGRLVVGDCCSATRTTSAWTAPAARERGGAGL